VCAIACPAPSLIHCCLPFQSQSCSLLTLASPPSLLPSLPPSLPSGPEDLGPGRVERAGSVEAYKGRCRREGGREGGREAREGVPLVQQKKRYAFSLCRHLIHTNPYIHIHVLPSLLPPPHPPSHPPSLPPSPPLHQRNKPAAAEEEEKEKGRKGGRKGGK